MSVQKGSIPGAGSQCERRRAGTADLISRQGFTVAGAGGVNTEENRDIFLKPAREVNAAWAGGQGEITIE